MSKSKEATKTKPKTAAKNKTTKEPKIEYYSTEKIDRKNATYNLIIGERSNGKTYAVLLKVLKNYLKDGKQFGYVRRWKEDITGRRAQRLFAGVNENGEVKKLTNGQFEGVHYYAGRFYLCTYEDGKTIYDKEQILGFTFSLSDSEHDKSTSYPRITTIMFDEFLTNRTYFPDEFVLFMNVVSTIVRRRNDVKIYMLGNTVNKFSPYFKEMGLNHIPKMQQGTIDLYKYGDSKLTVAVEYCSAQKKTASTSNHYFAFNNPKLDMITGGAWELNMYPHLPYKYKPKDIQLIYFIEFSDKVYQAEIIYANGIMFTFIHNKTTPIRDSDDSYIYTLEHRPEQNYSRSIFKPINKTQEKIAWFYKNDRVYYQDNEVGDAIHNFLKLAAKG